MFQVEYNADDEIKNLEKFKSSALSPASAVRLYRGNFYGMMIAVQLDKKDEFDRLR